MTNSLLSPLHLLFEKFKGIIALLSFTLLALLVPKDIRGSNKAGMLNSVGITKLAPKVTVHNCLTSTCTHTGPDTENPTISCPANVTAYNYPDNCSTLVNLGNPTTSDNCAVQSVTNDKPTAFMVGTTTVTWIVTDIHGNTASCTQLVTITDNQIPTAQTRNNTITLNGGTASVTMYDVDDLSFDNCGVASKTVNKTTFNCGDIGINTVTLTVTDIHGLTSSETATVTVIGTRPVISITKSNSSGFCQGGYMLNATGASGTYLWNTGATTQSIYIKTSGYYSVVVTNNYGCTVSASYYAASEISSHTLIATDEIKLMAGSHLQTGGAGVIGTDGEITLDGNSSITGTSTFAKAKEINVHTGCTVTTRITSPLYLNLPPFKNNHYNNSGNNVHITNNSTVDLNDSIYKELYIGTNATVTFTRPVVYIKKLHTNSNVKIKFSACTVLKIYDKSEIGASNLFDSDMKGVIIYARKDITIEKGSSFTGIIYTLDKIEAKGQSSGQISMKGMFIAEKIESNHTLWNWNTNCSGCSLNKTKVTIINESTIPSHPSELQFNVYPNPTNGVFNVEINSYQAGNLNIRIFNYLGQEIRSINKPEFWGFMNEKIDLTAESSTYFIIKIETGGQILSRKLIVTKP